MSEISDAVQIIRVAYDGVDIAMKVGSGSIEMMQKAVDLIVGMLKYEKTMGKTNLKGMLQKGGDIQVLSFADEDLRKFKKMAKKYGILYSIMPDAGRNDGITEVMFHSEAAPRVRMICQKLTNGRMFNMDEYLKNGNEEQLNQLLKHLEKEKEGKKGNKFPLGLHTEEARAFDTAVDGLIEKIGVYAMEKSAVSVEDIKTDFQMEESQAQDVVDKLTTIGVLDKPDETGQYKVVMEKEAFERRIGRYQELTNRMRQIAAAKNTDLLDITITKKLIAEENDHAIKTRIPGLYGDRAGYLWLNKADVMEIHNGKTLLTYLDKGKDYKIYSGDNRVLYTMKGGQLYESHYDKVERTVRERYAKAKAAPEKAPAKTQTRRRVTMQTTKKKPNILLIAIGAVLSGYLGYLVGGAWREGIEFNAFLDRFSMVCSYPLNDYYNEYTIRMIGYALLIYLIVVLMYYTSQRNLMPGREYGTSKFANIKAVNKKIADEDDGKNRILSQHVRMSLNTKKTNLNNNVLIIGGSGAGKTFFEVKPNIMQMNSSFIITDPKGEILRSTGEMLKNNGYNVKVINLLEMEHSNCYNPFSYIREETDVLKLITNLISNTTPKNAASNDPFWEKAEGMFLQALFYYVWLEEPPAKRNFETVLKLMGEAEVAQKGKPSPLDVRMKLLEEMSPLGENHPTVKQYNKCMRGAGDTVRSIIISANSRLATLENKQVLRLLSKDELNLAELGIGVNGDKKTKTALFCVIPDSDKTYNYIIGLLYTQIFQELYYQADFNYGGKLLIHVTFMLDEFANVALPDDYCSLLSTMRSREISSVIIIQNLAQIKALFKDTWETVTGNCDATVYLGGNEQSTHEYISKLLGKATIDKRSSGETRGRQGSSSRNYDVLGRELMTPDEVRMMDRKKCLVIINGLPPVMDDKFVPFGHPMFDQTADGAGTPYVHGLPEAGKGAEPPFVLLSSEALQYYEKQKENGEPVYIDSLSYEEFKLLGQADMDKRFVELDEQEQKDRYNEEQARELEYQTQMEAYAEEIDTEETMPEDSIQNRMFRMHFTKEQLNEVQRAMLVRVPKDVILSYFYPETPVTKMMEIRRQYE